MNDSTRASRAPCVLDAIYGSFGGRRTYFRSGDPEVLFAQASGPVTLVIFDGEHDMAYHPGLEWAHRLAARG
jgi:hypothetical protein